MNLSSENVELWKVCFRNISFTVFQMNVFEGLLSVS